jgi:hypothetical protein
MSSDLIGRRRAVQERLERARTLELSLKENTEILAESTGMSIEELDFDGSLRAALSAMTSLAARRSQFDVIVTIPDAPFAVRIRHINDAVSAEVVVHRDGPYDTTPALAAASAAAAPAPAYEYESVTAYDESATAYDSVPAPTTPASTESVAPPATDWAAPQSGSAGDQVASDLAALLWEDLDHMPS